MENHLTKDNIDNLTSKIWYNNFELGEEGCRNHDFYLNISDEFEQKYRNHDLYRISDKILRALCFIYNKKSNRQNKFDEEYCSYLYYWLGDKIYNNISNKSLFSQIITMIYDELNYNNIEKITICNHVNSSIHPDYFNINKLLFDYSRDYGNIKIDTAPGNTTCDSVFKEYLEEYIRIYNDAYSTCKQGIQKKYDCEKFSPIFNADLHKDLSTFNCIKSQNVVKHPERPKKPEENEITRVHDFPHPQATYSTRHQSTSGDLYIGRNTDSGVQLDQERIQSLPMNDNTDGGSSKTIAGSIVPVLGVSSFSLLLYKVTPVGGYINRLLGRNRNMYNQIEYMDAFNPYSEGMDSMGRRMNISYHRL
ncbi:PIR protein [Plasmodium vivax]|uniref:VIR protein n=1 Tax=Plasmodium vivax TaxID=5855 RepID=A0A565A4G4_PLAVI|nr:PIR protein [Plasmodium vivax]